MKKITVEIDEKLLDESEGAFANVGFIGHGVIEAVLKGEKSVQFSMIDGGQFVRRGGGD